MVPEPIDWPPDTPDHIRNPIPHRELCACGLLLSETESAAHTCPAASAAAPATDAGR